MRAPRSAAPSIAILHFVSFSDSPCSSRPRLWLECSCIHSFRCKSLISLSTEFGEPQMNYFICCRKYQLQFHDSLVNRADETSIQNWISLIRLAVYRCERHQISEIFALSFRAPMNRNARVVVCACSSESHCPVRTTQMNAKTLFPAAPRRINIQLFQSDKLAHLWAFLTRNLLSDDTMITKIQSIKR